MLRSALESPPASEMGTPSWLALPRDFGAYELIEEIGRGGIGVVYRARQRALDRIVALKLLLGGVYSSEATLRRFHIEAAAAAALRHPSIVAIHDYGEFEGQPFFTMELIEGRNLLILSGGQPLESHRVARYMRAIAVAVQYAHGRGILHRDLKPSNVLIDLDDQPLVADFGMAKRLDVNQGLTLTGHLAGSPNYAAPEQAAGRESEVGVATDVYSLGATLYHLLTGRPPFLAATLHETLRLLHSVDPIAPRHLSPSVPPDLEIICLKCLAKEPARRYVSAQELSEELDRFLNNRPIRARSPSHTYRLKNFVRRHKLGFAAALSIVASLVAGLLTSSMLLLSERTAHARATTAEQSESRLRHEAEAAREREAKRTSLTALDLASQLLEKDLTADALAFLEYAARKDPTNTTIAPRLASVITSHNFMIPEGPPYQCGSGIQAVHYTADGRSIYVGTEDGTFRIIDAGSGTLKREIHLGMSVRRHGWAFADKNEAVFAVCFVDKTIGLFDVKTGRPEWPLIRLEEADLFLWDLGLQFSPDARWLYFHGETCFWIWDALTGKQRTKQSFPAYYQGPEFTNDGTRVTFASQDTVQVWSLPEFRPIFDPIRIRDKYLPILGVASQFSQDGRLLLVLGPHGFNVFDGQHGTPMWSSREPRSCDGFLPDGRMISASDKSWDLIDLNTGKVTGFPREHSDFSGEETPSADGRFLLMASTDGFPRLWEKTTGKLVAEATFRQHDFFTSLSPDGSQVVIGNSAGAMLRLRVGRGAARPLVLPTFLAPHALPISFYESGPTRLLWFKDDHAVVLDVASGREVAGGFLYPPDDLPALQTPDTYLHAREDLKFFVLQDWTGHRPSVVWENGPAGIRRVGALKGDKGALAGSGYWKNAFSHNGDLFARAKSLHEIGIWDLHTAAEAGPDCTYDNKQLCPVGVMDISPDGKRLAAGTMDGNGLIWDVATGRVVRIFRLQSDTYCAYMHFSPDGTRLLTVTLLGQARLWNAVTGEPCSDVIKLGDPINHTGFSPDGRWIFSGDDTGIRIWDGKNGVPVSEPSSKPGRMLFSQDGERVALTDGDDVRVCGVRDTQPLTDSMHLRGPGVVAWSPDGRFLLIGVNSSVGNAMINISSIPPILPEGVPIPPWLLRLALICAGKKVNEAGQCVDAPEMAAEIGDVRRELSTLSSNSPYVEWGRWVLDDSPTRSIAPGFTITSAEADQLEKGISDGLGLNP